MLLSSSAITRILGGAFAEEEQLDSYAERILEAAEAQLFEHGLRRTSLERIAQAAGVSPVTLYRRFANRDALLDAVIARQFRGFFARLQAAVDAVETPRERMIAGVLAVAREMAGPNLLSRLALTDPEAVLPLLTTGVDEVLSVGRALMLGQFARARDEGMPISGDLELLAEVFVRLGHSLLLNPTSPLLGDEQRLVAFIEANLLPLLLGTGDD